MNTKMFFFVASLTVLAPVMVGAQQKTTDKELTARLERMASESDWKARTLSGAPKQKWLMHQSRVNGLIEKLKKGQEVDPKEIDEILREHYR